MFGQATHYLSPYLSIRVLIYVTFLFFLNDQLVSFFLFLSRYIPVSFVYVFRWPVSSVLVKKSREPNLYLMCQTWRYYSSFRSFRFLLFAFSSVLDEKKNMFKHKQQFCCSSCISYLISLFFHSQSTKAMWWYSLFVCAPCMFHLEIFFSSSNRSCAHMYSIMILSVSFFLCPYKRMWYAYMCWCLCVCAIIITVSCHFRFPCGSLSTRS